MTVKVAFSRLSFKMLSVD